VRSRSYFDDAYVMSRIITRPRVGGGAEIDANETRISVRFVQFPKESTSNLATYLSPKEDVLSTT
jgi:hypothetical protein